MHLVIHGKGKWRKLKHISFTGKTKLNTCISGKESITSSSLKYNVSLHEQWGSIGSLSKMLI